MAYKSMIPRHRLRLLPTVIILLVPAILFAPLLLMGKALFWGTPFLQFAAWWDTAYQSLFSEELPLWNSLNGMGAPLLANYQSGLFYPPNWIYFLLRAIGGRAWLAFGMGLMAAAHLALAGLGMARLARALGLGPLAQSVSGLAFGMSGYLVTRAGFLSINAAAAWLPWVLLVATPSLKGIGDRGRGIKAGSSALIPLVLSPIPIALQLLAGHAQTSWYTLLLFIAWSGYWGWVGAVDETSSRRWAGLKGIVRAWLRIAPAGALAVGLAAVQLLPTAEYLSQSQRSVAVEYEAAMTYSFWPWRFLTLLAPNLFGSPATGDYWGYGAYWEDSAYIGLLPLLLALAAVLLAIFRRKDQQPRSLSIFLFFITALSFLLALGQNTPIYPWLYRYIPTFASFQAPARWLLWAEFALALLAGIGAEQWLRQQGRGLYWTRLATMGAVAATLGTGLASIVLREVSPSFLRAVSLAGLWGLCAGLLALTNPKRNPSPPTPLSSKGKGSEEGTPSLEVRGWEVMVALLVAIDLLLAGWGVNPGAGLDLYRHAPDQAVEVRERLANHRLYLPEMDERDLKFNRFFRFDTYLPQEDWQGLRAVLLPNANLWEGIASSNNFDPLLPGRYARWMERLNEMDLPRAAPLLALMDVSLVERVDTSQPGGVRFDPVPGVEPRRWRWIPCVISVQDEEAAWESMLDGKVEYDRQLIVEEGATVAVGTICDPSATGTVELLEAGSDHIALRVNAPVAGWLLLSDVWYPGWGAQVDGDDWLPSLRADYLFQAVPVGAGQQVVVFSYRPFSFYMGLAVSLCSLVVLAGWFFIQVRQSQSVG